MSRFVIDQGTDVFCDLTAVAMIRGKPNTWIRNALYLELWCIVYKKNIKPNQILNSSENYLKLEGSSSIFFFFKVKSVEPHVIFKCLYLQFPVSPISSLDISSFLHICLN